VGNGRQPGPGARATGSIQTRQPVAHRANRAFATTSCCAASGYPARRDTVRSALPGPGVLSGGLVLWMIVAGYALARLPLPVAGPGDGFRAGALRPAGGPPAAGRQNPHGSIAGCRAPNLSCSSLACAVHTSISSQLPQRRKRKKRLLTRPRHRVEVADDRRCNFRAWGPALPLQRYIRFAKTYIPEPLRLTIATATIVQHSLLVTRRKTAFRKFHVTLRINAA